MSGILDSKTRVIDVLLTQEGRRQLADGKMKIEYVAFTDDSTYYSADLASGSSDATARLYLEACNLPQDQVTLEASDAGRLNPFKNTQGLIVRDGRILSSSFDASTVVVTSTVGGVKFNNTGSNASLTFLTGSQFASTADSLLSNSIDAFSNLRILGTSGRLFDQNKFQTSSDQLKFTVTPNKPLQGIKHVNINQVQGLISDQRLADQKNFLFLPPVNKLPRGQAKATPTDNVASYVPWGTGPLAPRVIHEQVSAFEKAGLTKTISFNPTSNMNDLMGQIFQIDGDMVKKLDVIDYGRRQYVIDGISYNRHYFFAGYVLVDDDGNDTFIHLFTLVFS